MAVAEMSLERHNLAITDKGRYFVVALSGGTRIVAREECPHRGGPLHLAERVCGAPARLRCRWHGYEVDETMLRKRSAPTVRVGGTLRAVLPSSRDRLILRTREMPANG